MVSLLTAFRPVVRNILAGAAPTRPADPYSALFDASTKTLYVVDSSSETLVKIDTLTGRALTLIRFQPDLRAGVAFDTVPTAACQTEDGFLISFLSGNPFPVGSASVRRWKPADTSWAALSPLIGGLTRVVDMICLNPRSSAPRIVTVEYLMDGANPTVPTGRVQIFDGSAGKILADKLSLPTAVVQDPSTNELLVLTLGGQILRLPVP